MTLLSDIINMKKVEREQELADINAIGSAVQNFVTLRQQNEQRLLAEQKRVEDMAFREVQTRNIESQITEREKVNPLEEIATRASLITDLQTAAQAGDQTSLNMLQELLGQQGAGQSGQSPMSVDDVLPQVKPLQGTNVDSFLDQEGVALHGLSQQKNILGEATPQALQAKDQLSLQKKKDEAVITGNAQADLQELKEGRKVRRNLSSGDLKLALTLGEFFKFGKEQQELLGLPAGPLGGVLSKITSAVSAEAKNKFLASFEGSRIELAAFVGRNAMPGTRAARIIDLFKETTPSPFDTIGSGIRNAAVSWGQTIATDFGANQEEYIPGYSKMSISEQQEARKTILKPYIEAQVKLFEDTYTIEAYKISPEMFTERDRANAENLVREDVRRRLRGK